MGIKMLNDLIDIWKSSTKNNYLEYYENNKLKKLSFKEVYQDVIKIIKVFDELNLKKGDRVAIIGTNGYLWVAIDLACLIKGIFTVTLDTNLIYDISEITDYYELSCIFTNLDAYCGQTKVYEFSWIGNAKQKYTADDSLISMNTYCGDDVFTTIFSSGTSGKQKTIEVRIKCFEDLVLNTKNLFGFDEHDKIMIFLPLYVYLERVYIYGAILFGFNILIVSPELVVKSLVKDNPTTIIAIPLFFENIYKIFMQKIKASIPGFCLFSLYMFLKKIHLGFLFNNKFLPFINIFGKNIRVLLTGSAPCRKKVLQFYKDMGITLYNGYGISEIAGMVALNTPEYNRIGSVGKPFPNKEVILAEDNEILVKGEYVANTQYYKCDEITNLQTYRTDQFIATGDIGYFDKDGYLYITGRKKDLIILNNGKKIAPLVIEDKLKQFPQIHDCLVYGDGKDYLVALIVPSEKSIDNNKIHACIKKINSELPADEGVMKFWIEHEKFTIENKMITKALKINRNYIVKQYRNKLDSLYTVCS